MFQHDISGKYLLTLCIDLLYLRRLGKKALQNECHYMSHYENKEIFYFLILSLVTSDVLFVNIWVTKSLILF